MAINVKLLRKIKRHILAKPRCLRMSWWIVTKEDDSEYYTDDYGIRRKFESCGTAACIAGWAYILSKEKDGYSDVSGTAEKLLNISEWQAMELFHVNRWPSEFGIAYKSAATPAKRARIAAKRIDQFIEENS